MPKTTASKKNRRNRGQQKNKRSRNQKAGNPKSRKNSPPLTNQRIPLRNEVELSPKLFLAQGSTQRPSTLDFRRTFSQITTTIVRRMIHLFMTYHQIPTR